VNAPELGHILRWLGHELVGRDQTRRENGYRHGTHVEPFCLGVLAWRQGSLWVGGSGWSRGSDAPSYYDVLDVLMYLNRWVCALLGWRVRRYCAGQNAFGSADEIYPHHSRTEHRTTTTTAACPSDISSPERLTRHLRCIDCPFMTYAVSK